jgi:hypothetical protein
MSPSRIILSRPFKFIVGADKVPIVVHEAAFADRSPGLKALMRGDVPEGVAGEAKWEDVDKETFTRFAQFVYMGDYSTPKMIVKSSDQPYPLDASGETITEFIPSPEAPIIEEAPSEAPPEAPPEDPPELWDLGTPMKKGKKKSFSRAVPTPVFKTLSYPLIEPRFNFADTCDPIVGDEPSKNIGKVLLLHASLYVLAEKWGIDSLKRLTLFKIHKTLSMFSLDIPKLEHIVHLVRYAYSDERTPDLVTKVDGLRELICQYIVANAELTSRDTTFTALIEEGGPLARDLWKLAGPRINSS